MGDEPWDIFTKFNGQFKDYMKKMNEEFKKTFKGFGFTKIKDIKEILLKESSKSWSFEESYRSDGKNIEKRELYKINGKPVSKDKFLKSFNILPKTSFLEGEKANLADIIENEKEVRVITEVGEKKPEVYLKDGKLVIKGLKSIEVSGYVFDKNNIKATYNNGVLEVKLPKLLKEEKFKIDIK